MNPNSEPVLREGSIAGKSISPGLTYGASNIGQPLVVVLAFIACMLIANADTMAEPPVSKRSAETQDAKKSRPVEKARQTYMGRIVAKPMSHLGASWLVRPNRNDEENAEESFSRLGIKPGMTLVDLGCGNGYWTLPMARACRVETEGEGDDDEDTDVQPSEDDLEGVVLAVDIQREMLQKLRMNMIKSKVENIRPVLGKVDDPKLPEQAVDLVLLVDVYHEFSHPESMLWSIRQSLKPEGVIALLEYRAEDPDVPIKPLHKMSKAQIIKEYSASNLKLVREYNELPWQHLMFFARDDSPLESIEPKPFR